MMPDMNPAPPSHRRASDERVHPASGVLRTTLDGAVRRRQRCRARDGTVHEERLGSGGTNGLLGRGCGAPPHLFLVPARPVLVCGHRDPAPGGSAMLLGCVAPMLPTLVGLGGAPLPTEF